MFVTYYLCSNTSHMASSDSIFFKNVFNRIFKDFFFKKKVEQNESFCNFIKSIFNVFFSHYIEDEGF